MSKIKAYAAHQAHGPLSPYEYEAGPLGADQVEYRRKVVRHLPQRSRHDQ